MRKLGGSMFVSWSRLGRSSYFEANVVKVRCQRLQINHIGSVGFASEYFKGLELRWRKRVTLLSFHQGRSRNYGFFWSRHTFWSFPCQNDLKTIQIDLSFGQFLNKNFHHKRPFLSFLLPFARVQKSNSPTELNRSHLWPIMLTPGAELRISLQQFGVPEAKCCRFPWNLRSEESKLL